ncbi:DUF4180 domain-containing protein [Phenylobacterium sp.]|uniref:DUF4180 domain-containing protein n=1 Tax=Phenylobacterium sp. TaxID=1871053 RepID=UPI002DF635C9|nr:DUF4180 domain-containing protein [Phenylobacterium sp.]
MSGGVTEIAGVRAWLVDAHGPPLADERDAADVLGETFGAEARLVVIPTARLTPDFLDLKTRLAGAILQKFVNYQRRVVILGDIREAVAASDALRDFVRESNRGNTVWFLSDIATLEAKLAAA